MYIYGRKVEFNLIKTIECPLKLKAKSLDFSPELKKNSPDKLLILLQKTKVPKMQNYSEFFSRSFIYGLIELEKLVTNIYSLFRFDHRLAEKYAKKVE
jgi:hypothetical protein